jgi:hypothetical protein
MKRDDFFAIPSQFSDAAIAMLAPSLPVIDERRLPPSVAEDAAHLRSQFIAASLNAQNLIRSMRDAWIAVRNLSIGFPGFGFLNRAFSDPAECLLSKTDA